jgi:hypothetical protein
VVTKRGDGRRHPDVRAERASKGDESAALSFEARHRSRVYAGCACYARTPQDNETVRMSLPSSTRQSMLTCRMKSYWTYILASRPRGTLYIETASVTVIAGRAYGPPGQARW